MYSHLLSKNVFSTSVSNCISLIQAPHPLFSTSLLVPLSFHIPSLNNANLIFHSNYVDLYTFLSPFFFLTQYETREILQIINFVKEIGR